MLSKSPKMQVLITQLAERHDFDLEQVGSGLHLEMPGRDPLVIEVVYDHLVSISQYEPTPYGPQDWVVANPGVFLFTGRKVWIPVEITRGADGHFIYAGYVASSGHLSCFDLARQRELARFSEEWADTLRVQGWPEHSIEPDAAPAPLTDRSTRQVKGG